MKKIALLLLAVLCCTALLCSGMCASAEEILSFEDTYVLSDLEGATIEGKLFDKSNYPADVKGQLRLIAFSEYAFSTKYELQDVYGLYFYLYNPRQIAFRDNELNKIQLATEYELQEGKLQATKWEKLHVSICSMSVDLLFVKFKIDNAADIYDRVVLTPEARQYDFSGIELVHPNETNAKEIKIAGTYVYSGFAKGCGKTEESTLTAQAKSRQVLELGDLQFTFYRNFIEDWYTKPTDHVTLPVNVGRKAQQLNSVYFSVPNYFADNYKRLYSIQAETYKYLTSPMLFLQPSKDDILIDSDKLYKDLLAQRGIATPFLHDANMDRVLFWDTEIQASPTYNVPPQSSALTGYNYLDYENVERFTTLAWVFQVTASDEISVTSDTLLRYARDYSNGMDRHTVQGKYADELFSRMYYSYGMDYAEFASGYMAMDVDVSGKDDISLLEADSTQSGWDKFWSGQNYIEGQAFSPIVEVKYNDVKGLSREQVSKKYHIDVSEVDKFITYVASQVDRTVYLFHFAQTDYFSTDVYNNYGYVGYMAQEVAFLDFDIISMGYEKANGEVEILPIVSDPTDVITAIQSGVPITDWDRFLDKFQKFWGEFTTFFQQVGAFFTEYWWVAVVIGVIVLLGILCMVFKGLWAVLKPVLIIAGKGLWYIISAPARLIVWIVNKAKGRSG